MQTSSGVPRRASGTLLDPFSAPNCPEQAQKGCFQGCARSAEHSGTRFRLKTAPNRPKHAVLEAKNGQNGPIPGFSGRFSAHPLPQEAQGSANEAFFEKSDVKTRPTRPGTGPECVRTVCGPCDRSADGPGVLRPKTSEIGPNRPKQPCFGPQNGRKTSILTRFQVFWRRLGLEAGWKRAEKGSKIGFWDPEKLYFKLFLRIFFFGRKKVLAEKSTFLTDF